ncbi:MAG: DUF3408 domain-containing protein [Tannerellaceae bacterium]|nr:DUF3408 domain-containing protein [Tannerellaceae bacterium]
MVTKQSENTGSSKTQNPDEKKQSLTRGKTKSSKVGNKMYDELLKNYLPEDIPSQNISQVNYEDLLDVATTKPTLDTKDTADTEEHIVTVPTVSRRVSGKQRKESLEEYRTTFLTVPKLEDRKPVFVSREIRDQLDEITRRLGGRKMSVSGFIENLARHHLDLYQDDIESWKKL